jgi:hypothetical protein
VPPDVATLTCRIYRLTILFLYCWMGYEELAAQRQATFGDLRMLSLPAKVDLMRPMKSTDTTTVKMICWARRSNVLWNVQIEKKTLVSIFNKTTITPPVDEIIPADFDHDGVDEIVAVHKQERMLSVCKILGDSLMVLARLTVPVEPQRVVAADYDNDRNIDIIVSNRLSTGLFVYHAESSFKFSFPRILVPELPFGDFVFTQVNDDDLIDLVGYDWVKSELHIIYGIGNGDFLDQTTIPLLGKVNRLFASRIYDRKMQDLVLWQEEPSRIQIWENSGFGEFNLRTTIDLKTAPIAMTFGLIGTGPNRDFVFLYRPPRLEVYLNSGAPLLDDPKILFASTDARQLMLADMNGDGKEDLLVLDRESRSLAIYDNGSVPHRLRDSITMTAGIRPIGLWAGDIDGTGVSNLAVLNNGGNTLSLFEADQDGGLYGANDFSTLKYPRDLFLYQAIDSTLKFVVTSPRELSIGLLSIDLRDQSSSSTILHIDGEPELLWTHASDRENLEFYAMITSRSPKVKYISQYRSVGNQKYIEKSFRLSSGSELLGAAVSLVNHDQYPDLVIVERTASQKCSLSLILGDSLFNFSKRVYSYEFSDTTIRKAYLYCEFLDGDSLKDLIVNVSGLSNSLFIFKAISDSSYANPIIADDKVRIAGRSQLCVFDFNGDGKNDILVNDLERGEVGWLKGAGNGLIEPWEPLIKLPFVGHFAVGDFNRDGITDIAISLSDMGVVKILNGSLLLNSRTKTTNPSMPQLNDER